MDGYVLDNGKVDHKLGYVLGLLLILAPFVMSYNRYGRGIKLRCQSYLLLGLLLIDSKLLNHLGLLLILLTHAGILPGKLLVNLVKRVYLDYIRTHNLTHGSQFLLKTGNLGCIRSLGLTQLLQ